ncbi:MAG TPA: metallophosphoesterase family protein, partial [Gemmatimonadaceae bacterium]
MEGAAVKVGLMADSHDRLPAINDLLDKMIERGVSLVMHAGDYCAPFALEPFNEKNVALLGIFGRNDGDPEGLKATAARGVGMELYESPHSFEVAGQRVLLVHDLGEVNRRSIEAHKYVVHGFTHKPDTATRGDTL